MPYPAAGGKPNNGMPGPTGSPGTPGKDGVGVSGSQVMYRAGTDGVNPPSTGWAPEMPAVPKGQYLWTRTITSFTDGTAATAYSVAYSAVDGPPGQPGKDGAPGNPGKDGSPGVAGKDGATGATGSPGRDGATGSPGRDGVDGKSGAAGVGVSGAEVTYQLSASGTTAPTGTWTTALPTPVKGQFLWTRTVTSYTNSTSTTAYTVAYIGTDGKDGAPGSQGSPGSAGSPGANGISYTPQAPVARTVTVATAYQHTDITKPYKVVVNARATQTVTVAGTVTDRVELRIGATAASVAPGGSGGVPIGVWESGITGIALMVGAAVQDGGQISADVPAGWYFSINRVSGTSATIVSCFTQSLTP